MLPGNSFLRSIDNSRPGIFSRSRDAPIRAMLSGAKNESSGCGIEAVLRFKFEWRVPDAVQRVTLLRRAGTHRDRVWTPDQQRTTPQVRRAAQHPGNNDCRPLAASALFAYATRRNVTPPSRNESPDSA